MEEFLKNYINRPLTMSTLLEIRCELEKNGYNISSVSASSEDEAFSLESLQNGELFVEHFTRKSGMWNDAKDAYALS